MSVSRHQDDKTYNLYHQYGENPMPPIGPIGLIMHHVDPAFADSVNFHLRNRRSIYLNRHPELNLTAGFKREDYRIPVVTPRFSSGEGKAVIEQSIRGHDLFIITDVLNRAAYYTRYDEQSSMTPDDHYQDLIRIILAASGKARRINLVMPYLYEGRQDHRSARESLDCAAMLKQLISLGIKNLITFDAHDGRVNNAVATSSFENLSTAYQIIESLIRTIDNLTIDADHFMVISPDENGIDRAIYYASMLGVPMGIFYRNIDYHDRVAGQYRLIDKKFLGDDVKGKDVLLVDDMIVTGRTMLQAATDLKYRGARRVYCAASFCQFTHGIDAVNLSYAHGILEKVFGTNLIYRSPELLASPWFVDVNLSRYVALLIDAINHDASLSKLISPTEKISKLLEFYKKKHVD